MIFELYMAAMPYGLIASDRLAREVAESLDSEVLNFLDDDSDTLWVGQDPENRIMFGFDAYHAAQVIPGGLLTRSFPEYLILAGGRKQKICEGRVAASLSPASVRLALESLRDVLSDSNLSEKWQALRVTVYPDDPFGCDADRLVAGASNMLVELEAFYSSVVTRGLAVVKILAFP